MNCEIIDTNEKGIGKFFLIAFFFGRPGIHRFMTGKSGTGILLLIIGWIFDLIKIHKGKWE